MERGITAEDVEEIINIGKYEADVCSECGEELFDRDVVKQIEKREVELGVFGLSRETKIKKIGASYGLIIPKALVKYFNIKERLKVLLTPEGKHKLLVKIYSA